MKNKFYLLLLFLMAIAVLPISAQITFKLKSIVGQQNPSSNGLFSYGTLDGGNNFVPFPAYGNDNTYGGGTAGQLGWTFNVGQESYPFLAFEQLEAGEVTPQPFPQFGIFLHPGDSPTVVRLSIPNNVQIISITNALQRATFGCGENIGYTIKTDNSTLFPRTIIATSGSPTIYNVPPSSVNAGNYIYFIVDKGDDGSTFCDDTALDVEITLLYNKVLTPVLSGTLNCNATNATFDIAFQQSGTLELYKSGNLNPIATTNISQVGNTFNGQGTFSGLNLSAGGDYYGIAKNTGQEESARSANINVILCCSDAVAPNISVNNLFLCQGETGILTVTGCTNGRISWNNGSTESAISVNSAGVYTATCTVLGTPPCRDGSSTASGTVVVNPLPTLLISSKTCAANLLTYSLDFSSNGTVTSTAGVVSGNSILQIPIGTNVILTATNSAGCVTSQTVNSPTCSCPVVNSPTSGGDKTICQNQTIPSLTASVGTGEIVEWFDALTGGNLLATGVSFTPNIASIFYAQARNTLTNCVSATRTAISLTINVLPNLNVGTTICSANLLTYLLDFTSNGTVSTTAGIVSVNSISQIPIGTNVTLTATSGAGCVITQTVNSPNCTCPVVTAPVSGGDKTICQNQAIPSLTASVGMGEIVEWYDAPTGGNLLATGVSLTPNIAQYPLGGIFYAQAKNTTTNCVSETRTTVKLFINQNGATPTIIASKNTLILGETVILNVTNCNGILTWNTGESATSITVKPAETTEYSATCVAIGGCVGGKGSIKVIVEVPKITANASPNEVCSDGSTVLSLKGCPANTIYWIAKLDGGRIDLATPTINSIRQSQTFTGYCETSAGMASADVRIEVRQAQNFEISASATSIVFGESTQLSSNACAGTLTWYTGQIGNVITVKPEKTSIYTAVCDAEKSCGGSGQITITVEPPKVEILGENVCFGQTVTLSQKGCNFPLGWVMWKKDDFSDAVSLETPTIILTERTRVRFTCATPAGNAIAEKVLEPIALPNTPEILSDKNSYLFGETATLTAANCNGYLRWSNGEEGKTQISVKPDKTSSYTAICAGGFGCVAENSIEIIVRTDAPKVKDLTLCYGEIFTLQSGCASGTKAHWTEDWFDIPNRIERFDGEKIKLLATKIYAVSCEGSAGYSEGVVITVTVKPSVETPPIQAEKTVIIRGDSLELLANGCSETEWTSNKSLQIAEKLSKIVVKPTITITFSARCLVDGCYSDYAHFKVLVRPKKPDIKASFDTLCVGNSTTITAQNCEDGGVLKWLHHNNNANSFEVFPQKDTTYQAVCIGLDSLVSDTTLVKVKVYQTPKILTITASELVIIEDERTTLTATHCEGIITWNTGVTGKTLKVSPKKNTIYSATCSVWRCVSERAEITIRVRPKQLEITDGKTTGFSINDTLCLQKQLTLSVVSVCNGTIVWSNGQSGKSITVVGTKNEVYEVFCQNADNEKSDISTVTILVKDYNIADAYVYPNPTSGKLFIQSKGCIDGVMLRLYTLRGELIYEGLGQERYLDSLVLDLFNLPSEEYVLHIIGTDGTKPVTLRKRVLKINKD